jgi:hypothetical protein
MQDQFRHLIRYAKAKSCTVSVYDGGAWVLKRSTNETAIIEATNHVEEAQLVIRDGFGDKVAWAIVIPGLEPDERIADYSANPWMDAWSADYERGPITPAPAPKKPTGGMGGL